MNLKVEDVTYILDVMNSAYHKVITNKPFCNVQQKVIATKYSLSLFFSFESVSVGTLEIIETFFSS